MEWSSQVYIFPAISIENRFVHLLVEFAQVRNVIDGLIESTSAPVFSMCSHRLTVSLQYCF